MIHQVNRWHNNRDDRLRNSFDTIERHQDRVADLCDMLARHIGHNLVGSDLLYAAQHHDEAETVLGDMPGPAKERFPELAAAYAKAELQVLTEMGLVWDLTRREKDMLAICDKLDAILWAQKCGVTGGEWDDERLKLRKKAFSISPECCEWVESRLATGMQTW